MEEVNVKTAIVFPGVFRASRIVHHQERAYVKEILNADMCHEAAKIFAAMEPGKVYTVCVTKTAEPSQETSDLVCYDVAKTPRPEWPIKHTTTVDVGLMDELIERMGKWAYSLEGLEHSLARDIRKTIAVLGIDRAERERRAWEQIERERILRKQGFDIGEAK